MPLELAGIGVERDGGIGVEIVAGAHIGVPVGRGIADTPDAVSYTHLTLPTSDLV